MRLFIAFELPEHTKEHLVCLMEDLKTELPLARWVKKGELHITAAFLGETDPDCVPVICDALHEVSGTLHPIPLELAKLGAFPGLTHASVLWAGIEQSRMLSDSVARIRDRLTKETPPISFDSKPFKPHITLARFKNEENLENLSQKHMERVAVTLTELVLFETVWLHGGGHQYEKRAVFPLH